MKKNFLQDLSLFYRIFLKKFENGKVYKLLSGNKIMVKRSLGTVVSNTFVGLLGGIGAFKLADWAHKYVSQPIIEKYGSDLIKFGGDALYMAGEWGLPLTALGIGIYGTIKGVRGADQISLKKQIKQYTNQVRKESQELKGTQEEIEEQKEHLEGLSDDVNYIQEGINKRTAMIEETKQHLQKGIEKATLE